MLDYDMPYRLRHRGRNPEDARLFSGESMTALRGCAADVCWLLSKGYPPRASLKIAGDRHRLSARQIFAVERCICTSEQAAARAAKAASTAECGGEILHVDGFNVLITVETILSGGLLFHARDGSYRDIAGIHGTYKNVEETEEAAKIVYETLKSSGAQKAEFILDRPVSNSGRLKTFLAENVVVGDPFLDIVLCDNPDRRIAEAGGVAVSSDSWILDRCARWLNIAGTILRERFPGYPVIEM